MVGRDPVCVIYIAFRPGSARPLLVAANRDEFHARASDVAGFWDDAPEILGGRDCTAGGTWLGVTRGGRFAAVTNYGEPPPAPRPPASRGDLTRRYLAGSMSAAQWAREVERTGADYCGFNLLVGDRNCLYYVSNRLQGVRRLASGVYAVANQLLDTDSAKIRRGKEAFSARIDGAPEGLFDVLGDRATPPDHLLPARGNPIEYERRLAPCFIVGADYGTRASTVVAMEHDSLSFVEQNYGPNGVAGERNAWQMPLPPASKAG